MAANDSSTQALIQTCLESNVLLFGTFTLKSGRISPYFFNAGLLYTAAQLHALAQAYASMIQQANIEFDVVFGPAYKGIALAAITCAELHRAYGMKADFAYNRKEAKDHGEGGVLVGAPLKGKRVLILDDVITSGKAVREAIDIIKKEGGALVGIAEILDRQEKGRDSDESAIMQVERETNVKVLPLMTLLDIISFVERQDGMQDELSRLQDYRKTYGVV